MAKKKKNIIQRILTSSIFVNLAVMAGIVFVLILITLFVLDSYTKHNESVDVPAVKGLQVEDGTALLRARELLFEVDSLYVNGGTPGAILEQTPQEALKVKKGRIVYLVIQAKTKQMIAIPSLQDYSQRQAEAQLNALGFSNINVSYVPSQYKGLVVSVQYKGTPLTAGQKIPKGSPLRMIVGGGGVAEEVEDSAGSETGVEVEDSFF